MRARIFMGLAMLMPAACAGGTPEAAGNAAADAAANQAASNTIVDVAGPSALDAIPLYPGARSAANDGPAAPAQGGSLVFRTSDSAGRVADYYAAAAERAGFSVEDRTDLGGGTTAVTVRRGAGEMIAVSATRVGDVTHVQVMASRAAR